MIGVLDLFTSLSLKIYIIQIFPTNPNIISCYFNSKQNGMRKFVIPVGNLCCVRKYKIVQTTNHSCIYRRNYLDISFMLRRVIMSSGFLSLTLTYYSGAGFTVHVYTVQPIKRFKASRLWTSDIEYIHFSHYIFDRITIL